jgi:hypothetical protein
MTASVVSASHSPLGAFVLAVALSIAVARMVPSVSPASNADTAGIALVATAATYFWLIVAEYGARYLHECLPID